MPCTQGCCSNLREHYLSIGIAAAALPNRGAAVTAINETERRWARDHAAYEGAVRQGLQPRELDGCDQILASAQTREQVEKSAIFTPETVQRAKDEGIPIL